MRKLGQDKDFVTITKPRQLKLAHHAALILYLYTASLRLIHKLERKNNVKIDLESLFSLFFGTTKDRLFIFETISGILQ